MMKSFPMMIAGAAAVHLTPENFDEMTAGKTVFLKMYAPWCGHCKKMGPDWDKLTADFADSTTAGVFDVDCTAEGKPICDANGVKGFPTIKWGDVAALEDYSGGRTYADLKKFADENLKPICSPSNIDLCDDEKKAQIAELQALSGELLNEKIETAEEEIETAETEFKALLEKLQKKYEKANKKKEETLKTIKDSGLGLMKAVKAQMVKTGSEGKVEL